MRQNTLTIEREFLRHNLLDNIYEDSAISFHEDLLFYLGSVFLHKKDSNYQIQRKHILILSLKAKFK